MGDVDASVLDNLLRNSLNLPAQECMPAAAAGASTVPPSSISCHQQHGGAFDDWAGKSVEGG